MIYVANTSARKAAARKAVALTFERFASECRRTEAAHAPLPVHVQFRKRGEILCGRVLDVRPANGGGQLDFFLIESELGICWCAHHNVRMCSGDGLCTCECSSETGPGKRSAGPVSEPPLGNTGVAA